MKRFLLCVLSIALLLGMTACKNQPAVETTVPKTDPAMPKSKDRIVLFYNDAIGRAVDSRLSFAKRYKSSADKFNLSPALSPFQSRLCEDTGVGQERDDVIVTPQSALTDSYERYLQRPSLTQADVRYAECTCIRGGLYRILLILQDGGSCVTPDGSEYASSLDRCGISAGDTTDALFDHKTAQNVFEKLRNYEQDVRIDESQSNVLIVAVFRPDGTPVQLNIRFDTAYDIKGICGVGCSAKGTTKIRCVQFGAESPVVPDDDE